MYFILKIPEGTLAVTMQQRCDSARFWGSTGEKASIQEVLVLFPERDVNDCTVNNSSNVCLYKVFCHMHL